MRLQTQDIKYGEDENPRYQGEMEETSPSRRKKSNRGKMFISFLSLIIIGVVAVGGGYYYKSSGYVGDYQAIFLANGQVYFGKASKKLFDSGVNLSDVFYIQVNNGANGEQNLQLVKLGNELHGPYDEMHINKDQVLFIEDLKSDSQVVKAIIEFKERGDDVNAAPQPAPQNNAPANNNPAPTENVAPVTPPPVKP